MIRIKPCAVCGSTQSAMIFANEPWCGDTCQKIYERRSQNDAGRAQK